MVADLHARPRARVACLARRAGPAIALLLLAGCWWPTPGAGSDRHAHNPAEDVLGVDTVGQLGRRWSATVGAPAGDPVTSVAGVHIGGPSAVHGFDPATGELLWTRTPAHPAGPAPAVDVTAVFDGKVLVGSRSGDSVTTELLGPATGGPTGAAIADHAFVTERDGRGVFWTSTRDSGDVPVGQVDVYDFTTGTWVCCDGWFGDATSVPASFTLGAGMFFHAGRGLVSTSTDSVGNGVRAYGVPAQPCPWLAERVCPTWTTPLAGTATTVPVLSDDGSVLYVGTNNGLQLTDGAVHAIDTTDGEVLWSTSTGGVFDAPALADGRLYVPTGTGLVVIDAATGAISWSSPGGLVTQQPAVAGGLVFVGSGQVMAFDAAGCGAPTCAPLWTDSLDSYVTGAPAVSNGQLYVGTADGRILAYGLPPSPLEGSVDLWGDAVLIEAFLYPGSPYPEPATPGTPEDLHVQFVLNQTFDDAVHYVREAAHQGRPETLIVELGVRDAHPSLDGGWNDDDRRAVERVLATPHPDTCIVLVLPGYAPGSPPDLAAEIDQARPSIAGAGGLRPNTVVVDSQPVFTEHGASGDWEVEAAHDYQLMLWSGVAACEAL